jgi:hypothetical protein
MKQVIKHEWVLRKPAAGEELKGALRERVMVVVMIEG